MPCHRTGTRAVEVLQQEFAGNVVPLATGTAPEWTTRALTMGLTNQTAATTGLPAPVRILGHLKVMSIALFLDNPDQPSI